MKQYAFLILCFALTSCDNLWFFSDKIRLGGQGYVYSSQGEPIDSVAVVIYHWNKMVDSTFTDQYGYFNGVRYDRCILCPKVKFEFKKAKHETQTLDVSEYLQKLSNENSSMRYPSDSIVVILKRTTN